jgi:acetyl esterase/lipase
MRRRHAPTASRWLRLVLAAAIAALVRAGTVRARSLQPVAQDLRTPLLFLPIAPGSPRHLRFVRRLMQREVSMPVPDTVTVGEATASYDTRPSVRVVTYRREGTERPAGGLIWIHGGGTVIGSPQQGHPICGRWVDELGLFIASVDYRLAPEHPYPAGLEDCYTALCWMHDQADLLGIDRNKLMVGGDSAGGLLAASLCQLALDRGGPPIRFQLLEYPMLDDRTVDRPDPGRSRSFVWSPKASRFGWSSYLAGGTAEDQDSPYAAPSRRTDLSGLPPAWIGVGGIDLLHDEAVAYAGRLRTAGVPCQLHVEPGMYHGADAIRPNAETSKRFTDIMTLALARGL